MRALILAVASATGVDPGRATSRLPATASSPTTCGPASFLVADGVDPSNEGRGYVLRRIMRRAMRHAQLLGAKDPLMWRLVPTLVREMGQAFPNSLQAEARIAEILRARRDTLSA